MRITAIAIAVLALGASISATTAAFARPLDRSHEVPIVYSGRDPFGVYLGKHKLGRDPDANTRETMKNAHRFQKGAY
jgi:hypothetical protein